MVHTRIARTRLLALARQFPALGILGPRQIGKSTLARLAFPDYAYVDLEHPLDFDRMRADPLLVLSSAPKIIIDEAQRFPALFPVLRSHLDRSRARVILLGSASPHLTTGISESLAGRIGLFELGGISPLEEEADAIWLKGAYPRVHWSRPRATPRDWYPSYLTTCLEQDLPQLGFRVSASRLRTFLAMIASSQGGICNLSEFGGSLGINYHAVAHLLDVLESVFLVRRLRPYAANLRKRLVKNPKLYIRDTGVLHSLLGIEFTRTALLRHAKAGASFETFCIDQITTHARLIDPASETFFFRTHTGVEVDLILKTRGRLIPVEIKLGLAPPATRGLEICMADLGLTRGYVVSAGKGATEIRRGIVMCGLTDFITDVVMKGPGLTSPLSRRAAR